MQTFPASAKEAAAMSQLCARVEKVISPEAWGSFAEDVLAIQELKKRRRAVVLAHNYMTPEIYYGVADVVGDSLAMAREAAKIDAEVIVVAGVHFMAETAKLLNPDRTVLIPDPLAGCSLAEAVTPEDVRELRRRYPGLPVVTYVNTSAAVKAECTICCTSGNAKKIVESLGVPEVVMIPDGLLAQNVARETKVKIVTWTGRCEVHERFTPQEVARLRQDYPGVVVIAHPECSPEVVAVADFAGSTAGMIDWIEKERPARAALLTEGSMSDNVAAAYPETEFVRTCLFCPCMKRITLKNIRRSLEQNTHEIEISEDVAVSARRAVERMMAVS